MNERFLENDLIRLRAVNPDDVSVMWEVESDSTQWLQNCMAAPLSSQNITDYALSYDADPFSAKQLRLIIELKENQETAGIIDLYDISAQNRTAFIGIYLIPRFRKLGLGTISLKILEKYAFYILNLSQLGVKIVYNNKDSINLFKNCGYNNTGTLPNWILSGNERLDLYLFSKNLLTYNSIHNINNGGM